MTILHHKISCFHKLVKHCFVEDNAYITSFIASPIVTLVSANFIARYGGFKFTEASHEGKYRELRLIEWGNIKVKSETPKFQGGFFGKRFTCIFKVRRLDA